MINKQNNKKRIFNLVLISSILTIIFSFIATNVKAGIRDSVSTATSGIGGSIGNYLTKYMDATGPTLIDFIVFFAIFFSICWIAFNKWTKDAKNATVLLSISVSVAFSIALVYGAKLTLKKLVPFAGAVLFIFLLGAIYLLSTNYIFKGDGIWKKILSAIITLLIGLTLLYLLLGVVCESEKCDNNKFTKKLIGSDSLLGKAKKWIKDLFNDSGSGGSSTNSTTVLNPGEERDLRLAKDFVNAEYRKYDDIERANRAQRHLVKMKIIQNKYDTKK